MSKATCFAVLLGPTREKCTPLIKEVWVVRARSYLRAFGVFPPCPEAKDTLVSELATRNSQAIVIVRFWCANHPAAKGVRQKELAKK